MKKDMILKRQKNMKFFLNPDTSITAAIYKNPVHFKKDGHWEDIDNTLMSKDEDWYVNTANAFEAQFAKYSGRILAKLFMDKYTIAWSLDSARSVPAIVKTFGSEKTVFEEEQKPFDEAALTTILSSLTYSGILPEIDLQYVLEGQTVKENIVLLNERAGNVFSFTYNASGLKPVLKNRQIFLIDEQGQEVFTILRPVLRDSCQAVSDAVEMNIEIIDEGFRVILAADESWLYAKDRVWPITLDPSITTSTAAANIHDTYLASGYPTDNFHTSHILQTGQTTQAGILRSFMQFTLPEMKSADMVISAVLRLTCFSENNISKQVNVHRITQPWESSLVTWNTKPDYDPKVVDFATFSDTLGKAVDFDITGIVKDWYNYGSNYGVMIKDSTEEGHYTEYLDSDCDNSLADFRPQILITYVNYSGLEDFWTYHSQNIGRGGTGYVNDYNGNLILTRLTASTYGNRMPAALMHVYNSNDKDIDFGYGYGFRLNYHQTVRSVTIGSVNYYEYVDEDGTIHYFYKDTEKQQWVDESGIQLTLTIGNGSDDKFTITDKKDQKLIFDSQGLLRKVEDANNNTLAVTWKNHKIALIEDGVGRTLSLSYNASGNLDSVTGPDGKVSFTYSQGMLSTITDVDDAVVSYVFDARRLMTGIINTDLYQVNYSYTAQAPFRVSAVSETDGISAGQSYTVDYGDNINQFTDHRGRREMYMFNDSGNTVCIKNHKGYAQSYKYITSGINKNRLANVSKLQYTSVQRLKNPNIASLADWQTSVSASGISATLNTSAVNAKVGQKSLKITSSVTSGKGEFLQNVSLEKGKNYVFSAYVKAPEAVIVNRKCFLCVETSDNQGKRNKEYFRNCIPAEDGWYMLEAPFTVPFNASDVIARVSAGIENAAGTIYFDCLQLEDGQVCSRHNLIENNDLNDGFTGFKKSATMTMFDDIISMKSNDTAPKAMIAGGVVTGDVLNVRSGPGTGYAVVASVLYGQRVQILGSANDGTGLVWYNIAYSSGTAVYSGYVSSEWVNKDQPSVTVNRGIINTDVLNVRSGAGTGYTALSTVTMGMEVNILAQILSSAGQIWDFITYLHNGTRYCGCVLSDYVKTIADLPPAPDAPVIHGPLDAHVLRMTGSGNVVKKLTQTLEITGSIGDVYVVNAWGAADCVPLKEGRTFGTEVEFVNTDGTTDVFNSNFGAATSEWQYLSDVVVAKKAYSAIKVSYIYGNNENIAYFDGLAFFKEIFGTSYTYDNKGNVVSSQDAAKKNNAFEYDENNNLKKLIDAKGKNFTYTYDSRHNITGAVTAANCKYTFGYDGYGNPTEGKVINPKDDSDFIRTTAEYTANGNNVASLTDALGNKVSYKYNNKDIVASVVDAMNHTMTYNYNAVNQLMAVMQDVTCDGSVLTAQTGYGYTHDRLTTISHNGFLYQMAYDGFGNRTLASVAGTEIVTNTYEPNNGNLLTQTYGNGVSFTYGYDEFDRLTGVVMTQDSVETPLYEYIYDNQGNTAIVKDKVNGMTYRHYYDLTDRLVMTCDNLGNSFTYIYDGNNNLTNMTVRSASGAVTAQYVYDDDNRETQTKAKSKNRTTVYDALGRVTSKTWNTSTSFATKYTYMAGIDGSKSSQISSITNGGKAISYTYDGNGNIKTITDSTGTTRYAYDELNRLVREDNHILGKTIAYIYDAAGNILRKDTYPKTMDNNLPVNPEQSVSYEYDTSWRDRLLVFDDGIIMYDAIGNPIRYGSWMMGWTQGRRLASMDRSGGETITFSYNEAGLRIGKSDLFNGYRYHYTLAGSNIVGMRCETLDGSVESDVKFLYDSLGKVVSMIYNGVEYYYVKNIQDDIIGLIDGNGKIVVNYNYDSWGRLLSVIGDTALGYVNPFRYRGYVADDETGLYYIGSRYYDPRVGRFVSADRLISSVGGSLKGNNMYVYCFNNPVSMQDSYGEWPQLFEDIANWVDNNIIQPFLSTVTKVKQDLEAFDWANEDETKVLDSNYISAYKGKLAIRTDMDRSGSVGILFIARAENNSKRDNPEDIIRHEYGHTKQLDQLGLARYLIYIGIPSYLSESDVDPMTYYRRPWEITADLYGGVTSRKHSSKDIIAGKNYLNKCKNRKCLLY